MNDEVRGELKRRFEMVQFDPHDFGFWTAIRDYLNFICATPATKTLLEEDAKKYRAAMVVIDDFYQTKTNETRVALRGVEVSKIEALSFYCHFLDLEVIQRAVQEISEKHLLHARNFECKCGNEGLEASLVHDGVKYEKELNEIRHGVYSKTNHVLKAASAYHKSLGFLHANLMNALFEAGSPQPEVSKQQPLELNEPLSLNDETGELIFGKHRVRISRRSAKNYPYILLSLVLKQPTESHPYSFLHKDLTGAEYTDKDDSWKVGYRAAQTIKQRVLEDTSYAVGDFLIFSSGRTGEVRINQKYLNK